MPTVGKGENAKHFPYDKAGKAAAKKEAKKTGKPMHEADGLKGYLEKRHGK